MLYTSDFETANAQWNFDNNKTWVWLWDICDCETFAHITGTTIDTFFETLKDIAPATIYFHNIEFDGIFILDYLLKNGYEFSNEIELRPQKYINCLITEQNLIYNIKIPVKTKKGWRVVEFRDSSKKIPGTVEDIAKSWKLPILKGCIDYTLDRRNYTPTDNDIAYIKNDTEIIARVLAKLYDNNMTKLTSAGDTFTAYKECIKVFSNIYPVLPRDIDDFIRASYRGGMVQVKSGLENKMLKNVCVYDVNSMYPAQMLKFLPYGTPRYYQGQYKHDELYPLYVQRVSVCFDVKDGHVPTILTNGNGYSIVKKYIKTTNNEMIDLNLTSIDLKLLFENYNVYDIEYIDGYKFKASDMLFKQYILPLYDKKCNSSGSEKQLAKILLNGLYGKFAFNPDHLNKYPSLDEYNAVRFNLLPLEQGDSIYTAVSSFITAYARELLVTAINRNYDNFIYCDTDSVHLLKQTDNIDVDSKRLGAWDLEKIYKNAKYMCQKRYLGEKQDGTLDVKCAGCTKAVKKQMNFDNFIEGAMFTGNLKRRIVDGGCLLVPTTFELKNTTIK